jgi:hypothetical protein
MDASHDEDGGTGLFASHGAHRDMNVESGVALGDLEFDVDRPTGLDLVAGNLEYSAIVGH